MVNVNLKSITLLLVLFLGSFVESLNERNEKLSKINFLSLQQQYIKHRIQQPVIFN